jgi:hypothetical protein
VLPSVLIFLLEQVGVPLVVFAARYAHGDYLPVGNIYPSASIIVVCSYQ